MAGVFGEFRIEDLEASVVQLNQFADLMGSRKEVLEIMGAFGESTAKGRIDSGGPSPDGTPWPAWSAAYALTRKTRTLEKGSNLAAKKIGHSLLRSSLALYNSIGWEVPNEESTEFGSNLVYAAVQNFGSASDDPHNIPAREYIGFNPDEIHELEKILEEWAQSKIEGLN